jgi:hypothetical protein
MWVPWQFSEGPEYRKSLANARASVADGERFNENLEILLMALKRDPLGCSEAFISEDDRLVRTRDEFAGYRLAVFFHIKAEYALELKWVLLSRLQS